MEPNQKLIDQGIPTIVLGDKEWPIPLFAPRQNRVIVPILKRFIARGLADAEQFLSGLDEAGYDDLIKMLHCALTAAHEITLREFEEMPMQTIEMTRAVEIVMKQTGIFQPDTEKKIVKMDPAAKK